ncbi:MAG: SDR family NAD(P)-dependent oxidoreductase [Verrucomicrobia bacterium]|nr:SDR family NAD(P)-dependent oxidoreductase [Verrucomicrobiota bacterium]
MSETNWSLKGRTAFITGGSRGLGEAIAQAFLEAGANVAICARSAKELAQTEQRLSEKFSAQRVKAFTLDVTDMPAVTDCLAAVLKVFGDLHVLVNNAGVYGPMGSLWLTSAEEWDAALRINIQGSLYPIRAVTPYFLKNGYGKIIQISGGGATSPLPRITAYAASKAAIVRLAESVAQDLKGTGIDVNSIAPGALNTKMMEDLLKAGPELVGQEFFSKMKNVSEQGGTPLEVGARLAVFLASKESDGITGRLISAPWDRWEDWPKYLAELDKSDAYTLRRITGKDRGLNWGDR